MMLIMTYIMNFEASDGSILEAETEVNFPNAVKGPNFPENACDETARRYIIGKILSEGGRVIKLSKAGYRWEKV